MECNSEITTIEDQFSDSIPGFINSLTNPIATKMIKNSAGNPPKLEVILIPSMPAKVTMINAIAPTTTPQMILTPFGGSGLSGRNSC